ncbi:MAG TPA: hypothetical protein VIT42_16320, partial [Microlunatus sp.]
FMTLRSAQVAAAKAAGDKDLAKQIGQLRKPTRSAWLVNLLARDAGADLDGMVEIGAALREAQENRDGAELRRLSSERHRAIEALTRRAAELGAAAEYAATEAVRQEVSSTLQAALADPDHADAVRRGTLSQAASYGGFGPFEMTAPVRPAPKPTPAERASGSDKSDAADQESEATERAVQEARDSWRQAREQLADAEAEAERVTGAADELADRVDELRTQLAAAEEAEAEARRTARTARKQVDEMSASERSARAAAEEAGVDTTG